MKLTQKNIASLPLKEDRGKADVIYFDDALTGFGIRSGAGEQVGSSKIAWATAAPDGGLTQRRFSPARQEDAGTSLGALEIGTEQVGSSTLALVYRVRS